MSGWDEPSELRESIELDQWLADLAGFEGNSALARELEARVREKQAQLARLTAAND